MQAVRTHLGNSTDIEGWYKRYEYFTQQQFASSPNPGVDIRSDVKFNTDGTVFSGPWGRPQNDGPASRAGVRVDYANWLMSKGRTAEAQQLYKSNMAWGGIKWELDWVRTSWSVTSFDVWEECNGYHFYTLMMARKALYKGAVLAYSLQDYDFALELLFQAANINQAIPQHFDDKNGMIFPMINTVCADDRQSMDIAVQLATIYGDIEPKLMQDVRGITQAWYNGMCASGADQRCPTIKSYLDNWAQYGTQYWTQPKAHHHYHLFSLWNLSKWSQQNFQIGSWTPTLKENVIARYAWDRYDGYGTSRGNPWIISSMTASQVWNRAVQYFRPNAQVDQFEPNYTFYPQQYWMWNEMISNAQQSQCPEFKVLLNTLQSGNVYSVPKTQWKYCATALRDMFWNRADDAIRVPFAIIGFPNSLTEQIHRDQGTPTGAEALTWNYSTMVFADFERRNRDTDPK